MHAIQETAPARCAGELIGRLFEVGCAINEKSVETQRADDLPVALLHCVSDYPCAPSDANLRALDTLAAAFPDCVIGWSDHSEGLAVGLELDPENRTRLLIGAGGRSVMIDGADDDEANETKN